MVDPAGGREVKPAPREDQVKIYSKALNIDEQQVWHKEAASVAERSRIFIFILHFSC